MALAFSPPIETRRASNPATELATRGRNAELLGYTEPRLNGQVMVQGNLLGELPPRVMNDPDIRVLPLAQPQGWWEARVRQPFNTVSWQIELPPDFVDGVWTAQQLVGGAALKGSLAHLLNVDIPSHGNWLLKIRPLPDPVAFFNHIRWHEYQHVADHRWLAQQIIGPWDEWYSTAQEKALKFQRKSKVELESSLKLKQYTESTIRIVRYWQAALYQSGDLYHHTRLGSTPILQVARVQPPTQNDPNGELELTIEATERILSRITMDSHPHTTFGLKPITIWAPFGAGNMNLSGNEPKITKGAPVVTRSLLEILGLNTRRIGETITTQDDDDYEGPPLF